MKGGDTMKKFCSLLFLLTMALSLTSCKVNWFGETREVAWYVVVIPILLALIIAYTIIMTNTYVCPHCKKRFKSKPHQLYTTIHFMGKRIAKCPHCGRKSFCKVQKR